MKLSTQLLVFVFTLFISISSFALKPSLTYKIKPERFNMKYTEEKIKTKDGKATLNVWNFPAKSFSKKTVLIMHNGEGNMADYMRRVDQFISIGQNVILFDYRGFGESSEFAIDSKQYIYKEFQDDVKTMIEYGIKKNSGGISIYGWGIGAGLGLGIGVNYDKVNFIIADTPFLSLDDHAERLKSTNSNIVVTSSGYNSKNEPIKSLYQKLEPSLKKIKIIVSSTDDLYKSEDYKPLMKLQKKLIDKEVLVIDNPDKKDNFRADKVAYFEAIKVVLSTK